MSEQSSIEDPETGPAPPDAESLPLDYASPRTNASTPREECSPPVALTLAAPGIYCWVVWLLIKIPPIPVVSRLIPDVFSWMALLLALFFWPVAVLFALISLAYYLGSRKPWYVWLNLIVNISGLCFTVWFFGRDFF